MFRTHTPTLRKPLRISGRDAEWRHLAGFAAGSGPRIALVAGRRRQGKTLLLDALARATGGLHLAVPQATGTEALRLLADEVGAWTGEPVTLPAGWEAFLSRLVGLAARSGRPVVLDDVPHLLRNVPELAELLAQELATAGGEPAVLLASSVPPVTAALRTGPLRERIALDLTVRPPDHRAAARLWNVDHDPHLAVGVHAVVGSTAAYHRFACADSPADTADFDAWVQRTVLEPTSALFGEARYLTAAADVRDPALYHSLLAAVAAGTGIRGAIADHVGRRSADIGHHLNLLEDAGLLRREPDVFRAGRTSYRVLDPLVAFHHVVMRPRWAQLECGRAAEVWKDAQPRFAGHVAAHFAQLCREHAPALVSGQVGHVGTGVVTDPRAGHVRIDIAVLAPAVATEPPRILALGLTSWDRPLGAADAARLHRARTVLGERGYDVRDTRLVCAGAAGVDACDGVLAVRPADLYACP
ncbi:MAG: ATP-binding protein [Pseudonocardia sp.]